MQIDEEFMNELGLNNLPAEERRNFMEQAEAELERRVGHQIGLDLSEEQLAEFDAIMDPDEATAWLETNAPNYREVVKKVFREFKAEMEQELA